MAQQVCLYSKCGQKRGYFRNINFSEVCKEENCGNAKCDKKLSK